MTTIVINNKTKAAKAFLEFAKSLSFVTVVENNDIPNETTINAIIEATKGKTVKCENFDDYLQKVK